MRRLIQKSPIDPFLLSLIATVALASLWPARGGAVAGFAWAADFAIALLFFLHGAKLSRAAMVEGMGNWRLHLMVLASTYVLFPAIGLALNWLEHGGGDFGTGLLFLTLLPSTVQSSIAFTAIARGNVAAAVCSASLSNLLGIVLTPLLVTLFIHTGAQDAATTWAQTWGSVRAILVQLLLPFVAGHALRPWIGGFITRHKAIMQPVDRSSILLVVYAAFSAAVVGGLWHRVGWGEMAGLIGNSTAMLALVLGVNMLAARVIGLSRADAVVLLFCGSKKSLVSGVPMAGALFAPAAVGQIVLPLMVFHQLQLFVCAALAGRFARAAEAVPAPTPDLPRTAQDAASIAASRGLAIPDACMPGVVANLGLLARHARIFRGMPPEDAA